MEFRLLATIGSLFFTVPFSIWLCASAGPDPISGVHAAGNGATAIALCFCAGFVIDLCRWPRQPNEDHIQDYGDQAQGNQEKSSGIFVYLFLGSPVLIVFLDGLLWPESDLEDSKKKHEYAKDKEPLSNGNNRFNNS
jgi:hypothetical protein